MAKRVWILGAGFSRPLGGPLLPDLMRPEVKENLAATYPEAPYRKGDDGLHDLVLRLYGHGSKYQQGKFNNMLTSEGENIWADAEQFLDYLDTAVAGGPSSPAFKRLSMVVDMVANRFRLGTDSVKQVLRLSRAAKRLVAGTCSAFLAGADPNTERWEPYVKWAKTLGSNDTIITFNYDCVLELLNTQSKNIHVVRLGGDPGAPGCARLLKLHGSVNWMISGLASDKLALPKGGEQIQVLPQSDFDFSLKCEDHELAIASPGPIKKAVSAGWLAELWDIAARAIEEADAVVFIGYRFPPSDSHARQRLLSALTRNSRPYLAVHTVLGLQSPDTPRLTQLLRFALSHRDPQPAGQRPDRDPSLRRYTLANHPLYGEDFLSVFPEGWLTEAYLIRHG